jgi:hypothetical protein
MQQLYRLNERRPCQVCRQEIVYGALGWLHVRKPKRPHTPTPVAVERQASEVAQGQHEGGVCSHDANQ